MVGRPRKVYSRSLPEGSGLVAYHVTYKDTSVSLEYSIQLFSSLPSAYTLLSFLKLFAQLHLQECAVNPAVPFWASCPGGYTLRQCEVHTRTRIFGTWLLLPLRTNKSFILLIADSLRL